LKIKIFRTFPADQCDSSRRHELGAKARLFGKILTSRYGIILTFSGQSSLLKIAMSDHKSILGQIEAVESASV
jgi:hypothetical protein